MSLIADASMKEIRELMAYLKVWSLVIPHYNLPIPEEAEGANYRPDRTFRLLRSGTMTYSGTGGLPANITDVFIGGISPTGAWLTRAYLNLIDMVKEDIRKKIKGTMFHYDRLPELLLRFNGIDFVNWKDIDV